MAVDACPYYEFREVLSVRDADAPRFRSLADLRGKTVGTLGGTIAYDILLRAEREHGLQRRLVRRRRASVQRSGDRPRRRGAARQRARRAPRTRRCPASRFSRRRSRSATTSACSRPPNAPLRDSFNEILRGAMRDGRSSGSSASGRSGTTISRGCTQQLLAGEPVPAVDRLRHVGAASPRVEPVGSGAALPAVAAAGVGRHHRAVVPVDGAGGRARRADRDRTRLRRPRSLRIALTAYVELIRGTPILLQLFVLYYGLAVGDPAAGVRRRAARPGAELRGVRERDLPVGARSDLDRPARGRAHARAQRAAGADAGARRRRRSASRWRR